MSLMAKIMLGYLALAVLVVVVGLVGVQTMSTVTADLNQIVDQTTPGLTALGQIKALAARMASQAAFYALVPALREEESEEVEESNKSLDTWLARYQAAAEDDEERSFARDIKAAKLTLYNAGQALMDEADADGDAILAAQARLEQEIHAFEALIDRAIAVELEEFEEQNSKADQGAMVARLVNFLSMLASVVGGSALAFVLARAIINPIHHLKATAEHIAHGDYARRIEVMSADEVGQLAATFNAMADAVQQRDVQLRDFNATLEKRVEERTIELQRANALAQESVRLKSEFMSTMSHELRTPLSAIIGFCGIMLEGMGGQIDDDARGMLERINANSTRLLNLINQILDLARIEAGRMELVNAPMFPRALAMQWQAQMQVLADTKGLAFTVNVDPNLPETILGDAERVTQIAVNLLSNAFKFTHQGSVTLDLKREDSAWIIQVSDTGVGIPPHAINYIFDEFRQVDGTSTRVYSGSGLGLAIVRNLCLMMGGQVRVTSALGEGSTFTVTLPLQTEKETEVAQPEMA